MVYLCLWYKRSILFLFLLSSSFIQGQTKIGLVTGVNVSHWLGSVEKFDFKTGFAGGTYVQYYIDSDLLVYSGLIYSREGWQKEVEMDTLRVNQVLSLNYIALPIAIGVYGFGDQYRGLRFNFGLEFKYLLNQKSYLKTDQGKEDSDELVEINDFDIAGLIGADYQIDENVSFFFQIQIGFLKVNKTSTTRIITMHNQQFRLGLAYFF